MKRTEAERYAASVRGCLLGGAIGDALGGPVEFASRGSILAAHPNGLREFVAAGPGWPAGTITDDTQMTLFTAEGLIRAGVRRDRGLGFTVPVVHAAYDRWLDTQLLNGPSGTHSGWLEAEQWLYVRRAPGTTCLSALQEARQGGACIPTYGGPAANHSKGCGGVMRVAPVGLLPVTLGISLDWTFETATAIASYTHGHITGRLAAGALAVMIRAAVEGAALDASLQIALEQLATQVGHEETSIALTAARQLAAHSDRDAADIEQLGDGWVAEEALSIAVYAALVYPRPEQFLDALSLAVTHSGDSDSTGAICGNLLGAAHGETALPAELAFAVEGRPTILLLADDFVYEFTQTDRLHSYDHQNPAWVSRYPGV